METLKRWKAEKLPKQDLDQIMGMLIPLGKPDVEVTKFNADSQIQPYTCKNFNTVSRNCMIYDKRPRMCSDYGVRNECRHKGCTWEGASRPRPPKLGEEHELKDIVEDDAVASSA